MADFTLLELSAKLSMLFLLVTAQRSQTLHLIETKDMEIQSVCYKNKPCSQANETGLSFAR